MGNIEKRIERLERGAPDPYWTLPARMIIVEPDETEEAAYLRVTGSSMPRDVESKERLIFILLVEPGPDGGPPDPNNPEARCRPRY